jgi:hypothetical protein
MQKNRDLAANLQDRIRQQNKTQELYDKLKRKAMLGHVKDAAFEAATDTIQASVMANHYADLSNEASARPPIPPLFRAQPTGIINTAGYGGNTLMGPPPVIPNRGNGGNWNSFAGTNPALTTSFSSLVWRYQMLTFDSESTHSNTILYTSTTCWLGWWCVWRRC